MKIKYFAIKVLGGKELLTPSQPWELRLAYEEGHQKSWGYFQTQLDT